MCPIVIFSEQTSAHPAQPRVASWDAFLALGVDPAGFWIDRSWQGDPGELAWRLRTSAWWDRLAFSALPCADPLLDGQLSLEETIERCSRAEAARQEFAPRLAHPTPAEKLLLYLYLRGAHEMAPAYDRNARGLYTWPLAAALGAGQRDDGWFERLVRSGLLRPVRLVDRLRACTACGSAHLSYAETCPECGGIDIVRAELLHCFTCGHVDDRDAFGSGDAMCCPKCRAQLRHIGVDHDRPAARYRCNQCRHVAMEPRVVASCFDCGRANDPSRLQVRDIRSWSLDWQGVQALRQGLPTASAPAAPELPVAQFRQVLLWAVAGLQRRPALGLALLRIEAADAPALEDVPGAAQAMLDEAFARLRAVLRASDLACRDQPGRLWLLLPMTPPQPVAARLLAYAASLRHAPGAAPALRITPAGLPAELGRRDAGAVVDELLAAGS
jgi:hypothetical protein